MYWLTKLRYYLNVALIFYSGLFITPGLSTNNTLYSEPNEYQDTPTNEKTNLTNLRFVSVIFRHGDRTPAKTETYPNDPYKDDEFYPIGRGQLTNDGKERSYELGLLLRNLYHHFLGTVFYEPYIYARSTFVPRCKMTLQLVLAALFPPDNNQKWSHLLLWQPMNVKYGPANEDSLLMTIRFPSFEKAFKEAAISPEMLEKTEKYRDRLMKEVSMYTGTNITNILHLTLVRLTIHLQLSMKLKLPEAAHTLYANKELLEATYLGYDLFNYNEKLVRLNGGTLLRKIVEDMNEVINGTLTKRKMNLFSAHDFNVSGMLRALHIKDKIYNMPNFTSSVILELRERNDKYFVKVLYYWGIPAKLETLCIPGCELLCPYDKFLNLTSTTIATDVDLTGSLDLTEDSYTY